NVNIRTRIHFLKSLLLFVTVMGFCRCAGAASTAIWRIGKFDRSSGEFNQGSVVPPQPGATQAKSDLVYVIGRSKAETDWPAFQPGSSNGMAGYRTHPYAIQFELPSAPRGLYTLKVAL